MNIRFFSQPLWQAGLCLAIVIPLAGCISEAPSNNSPATIDNSSEGANGSSSPTEPKELQGAIKINGSSTVYPVSQAVAVEFGRAHPDVKLTVGGAGTGTGMKEFMAQQIDICDASRLITDAEKAQCEAKGIKYLELSVAIDGLSVVVNPANDWIDSISIPELHKVFAPDSSVKKWSEIRDGFPDQTIKLYTPDAESGTFDYFTEVVNGKAKVCRTDISQSTNDNILVSGVSGDKHAFGYFGYAYYVANKDKLKALAINATRDAEAVLPTEETIENGTYTPLSRPLFIYVNLESLKRREVAEFLKFYMSSAGQDVVAERGYIRLNEKTQQEMQGRLTTALGK